MYTVLNASQNYYIRGGSDRVFFDTMRLLQENGHVAIPFAAQDDRNEESEWAGFFPEAADFDRHGPSDLARYLYSRPAARQMRRLVEQVKPDIAHLHIYYGKLTASILRPLHQAGVPIVQSLHEYKLICPVYTLISNDEICEACAGSHFYRAIPRRCNRGSLSRSVLSVVESYVSKMLGSVNGIDHFVSVSNFQRDTMIRNGVPADRITTVNNFVDWRNVEPSHSTGAYFLYSGRIERIKGVFTLLEAAAPLTNIQLLYAGEGSARLELEAEIERRQLKHIRTLGFLQFEELTSLISGAICLVVPSLWYEPFGLIIAEGLSAARPVIGSRIGAIPEVIDDGVDGLLFEPGNAHQLRTKLQWMSDHPIQALEMGAAGREKVKATFCQDVYYEQLMQVYQRAIEHQRTAHAR